MAKAGQQIQSALLRDPRAGRPAVPGRQLPASTFRKVTAPPPRNVAPMPRTQPGPKPAPSATQQLSPEEANIRYDQNMGMGLGSNTPKYTMPIDQLPSGRLGIGQFEQDQLNRQIPPALPVSMIPSQPAYGGQFNQQLGQYQPGQVGIGSFMQNQFQPQPIPSPASSMAGGALGGPIMGTAQQSPAMNQAAQIAQGGMLGAGQAFRR